MERNVRDAVDALLFWAVPALDSAERVLRWETIPPLWGMQDASMPGREHHGHAALMVLALRNVLRAAQWAATELRSVGPDVEDIPRTFEAYIPGLKDARDALEHFDEYAVGKGRLQRADPRSYEFDLVMTEGRPVVHIGPLQIDVQRARDACRWLVVVLLANVEGAETSRNDEVSTQLGDE